jgi:hypothetical protein
MNKGSNSFAQAIKKSEQARIRIEKKKEAMRKKGFSEKQIKNNYPD